jgi:hypothetical protein
MKKSILSIILFCIIFSCKDDLEINQEKVKVTTLESVTAEVLSQKKIAVGNTTFTDATNKITMKLSGDNLPIGINFKGYDLLDNGQDLDEVAGDHIYTSRMTVPTRIEGDKALPSTILLYSTNSKSLKESWYFKCSGFSIVQNGEKCGSSTCKKSISGGEAWICVCGGTCDFCFGSDCGQK